MKIFKRILAILMCALLACGLFACSGDPDDDDDNGGEGQVTLTLQSATPLRPDYKALLRTTDKSDKVYNQALFTKKVVDGFKELYPNVRLKLVDDGWNQAAYQKQMLYVTDWKGGGKMAVDMFIGEVYMNQWAKNGVFAEIDSTEFSHVLSSVCDGVTTINGKTYGIPLCTSIMGLQYNTQILTEVGIPQSEWVPATWDQLLQNCKKVSEYAKVNKKDYGGIVMNNVAGMSGAFRAIPFLRQAGGDLADANGNLTINTQNNIDAFTYLRELAKYAYQDSLTCDSEDTVFFYFSNKGYGAYMIDGQWAMTGAGDHIKSAALPSKNADGTGTGNVFCGSVIFGITEASEHKAEAQAFLKYITSAEIQKELYKLDGRLPVNTTVLNGDEVKTIYPNINAYIDQLNAGGFSGGLPCFTKNASQIWESWGSFYKKVLTGTENIATLVANVHNDIANKMA